MESNNPQTVNIEEVNPAFNLGGFALLMLAAFLGALTAAIFLPNWMPSLTQSVAGANPKAFWYLSRGSAFSAYSLLWLSMLLGTGITNKLSVLWPGLPPTIEIHQYTSILGLAFGLFHGLILMGDQFMNFSLAQVLVPFATSSYRPLWVGIGQVGFYSMLIVTLSFYVRKKIGPKTWRAIHFVSFATFVSVLVHALMAGTDASAMGTQLYYLITSALLLFMIVYRVLISRANAREKKLKVKGVPPQIPTR